MSSTENHATSTPLHPFPTAGKKIKFRSLAGGGGAGYVFRVSIGKEEYALKMFKFYIPELHASRFKGSQRRALYDSFFVECRANNALIRQGLNGQITPFCYGWLDLSRRVEHYVARKFDIQPVLWDRPVSRPDEKIRGILFQWVDGQELSQVPINANIADQARSKIRALHSAGIIHGSLTASNFLVQGQGSDQQLHLLDLGVSITSPHFACSAEDLSRKKQIEAQLLEIGFTLLSTLPINNGLCVADMSPFEDSKLNINAEFIKHQWAPPRPTYWTPNQEETKTEHGHPTA